MTDRTDALGTHRTKDPGPNPYAENVRYRQAPTARTTVEAS